MVRALPENWGLHLVSSSTESLSPILMSRFFALTLHCMFFCGFPWSDKPFSSCWVGGEGMVGDYDMEEDRESRREGVRKKTELAAPSFALCRRLCIRRRDAGHF